MRGRLRLVAGTLELLVLEMLSDAGSMHGFEILDGIRREWRIVRGSDGGRGCPTGRVAGAGHSGNASSLPCLSVGP